MKRNFNSIYLAFLPLFFVMVTGCKSTEGLKTNNLAHMYSDGANAIQVQYKVFHKTMDQSELHFSFPSSGLLYVKNAENQNFESKFAITYKLFTDYEMKNLVDSGTTFYSDSSPQLLDKALSGQLQFRIPRPSDNKQFLLVVYCTDFNRKFTKTNYIDLDIRDPQAPENFLRTDTAGNILFGSNLEMGTPFLLHHNQKGTLRYRVRYYKQNFPIAVPPHVPQAAASLTYVADSIFEVDATKPITLTVPGMYHFQIHENSKSGFTVMHFYPEYPYVSRKEHLAGPLRYLTNNTEFLTVSAHQDTDSIKLEADRFWLENAGSAERARNLIAAYYSRVEASNRFFTSYLEGWKTDRGLIYTVYGPPTAIYREELTEQWIYGEQNSSLSYVFTFVKVSNPFTNNDYALTRLTSYRYGWGQAIETWRKGQVYGVREIKKEQDERDQQLRMQQSPYFWY
jgi:GWxTD domain-containing protein